MNLPLNIILTELSFGKQFNKIWHLIIPDTYKNQSFIKFIYGHLKLPETVNRLLYPYT
tara:strand:+ start:126 stop:299 length:174 start_codon:yes stop_codon:yes gene_type:complete